jgi:hypothetical protein
VVSCLKDKLFNTKKSRIPDQYCSEYIYHWATPMIIMLTEGQCIAGSPPRGHSAKSVGLTCRWQYIPLFEYYFIITIKGASFLSSGLNPRTSRVHTPCFWQGTAPWVHILLRIQYIPLGHSQLHLVLVALLVVTTSSRNVNDIPYFQF